MATMKVIKKRISSVNNTRKIMKAMDLVATSKLQKARLRFDDFLPMCENIKLVMEGVKASIGGEGEGEEEVEFAESRDVKSIAYVVLTSDRGLCGGFNVNISKEALAFINANEGKDAKIIAVGSKGADYFRRRGKQVVFKYAGASESAVFESAELIGDRVTAMYKSGEVDEVYLIYSHFESVLAHSPRMEKLLPIMADPDNGDDAGNIDMKYDPDVGTFISYAVPMYINITVFGAMLESALCEYSSRMTSMDSATRNATDLIDDLTLEYNRVRQGLITQEITEIVSGANALK
ncbi:MAG: ATP synthase F1 subunit gamma [Oscillospiraceae bacterium]|nr:ATP synthase F1 subunit gamma [Oscillospiraceae bacterium]